MNEWAIIQLMKIRQQEKNREIHALQLARQAHPHGNRKINSALRRFLFQAGRVLVFLGLSLQRHGKPEPARECSCP
ncbi:MAG: hypothetical protein AB1896_10270 [Thermodesulfobacteriota bacterium]